MDGIKIINTQYSINTKYQLLANYGIDLIILLIIIGILSISLYLASNFLLEHKRYLKKVSSISSLLLCLMVIGGALYICYISPYIDYSGGRAGGISSDILVLNLTKKVISDGSQEQLNKPFHLTITIAAKDGHTDISDLPASTGGSQGQLKDILCKNNSSSRPVISASLYPSDSEYFEASPPGYRDSSLEQQSITWKWSVKPKQAGKESIDPDIELSCSNNVPLFQLPGIPTLDFQVTNPNDNIFSQTLEKVDPSAAIAAALGTLITSFVVFVAVGTSKRLRRIFEKGGPVYNNQQQRTTQIKRKRKAKHGRAK